MVAVNFEFNDDDVGDDDDGGCDDAGGVEYVVSTPPFDLALLITAKGGGTSLHLCNNRSQIWFWASF